jgi:hypothetical protein
VLLDGARAEVLPALGSAGITAVSDRRILGSNPSASVSAHFLVLCMFLVIRVMVLVRIVPINLGTVFRKLNTCTQYLPVPHFRTDAYCSKKQLRAIQPVYDTQPRAARARRRAGAAGTEGLAGTAADVYVHAPVELVSGTHSSFTDQLTISLIDRTFCVKLVQ